MPRPAVEDNKRISLRILAGEKAVLLRAAALQSVGLSDFVRQHSLNAAMEILDHSERVRLSARDSLRVLEALENPPAPNAKLLAAARALRKRK